MLFLTHYTSPIGLLTLTADARGITGIFFADRPPRRAILLDAVEDAAFPVLARASLWLDDYFRGHDPAFSLPLCPLGSDFEHAVWELLLAVPYGESVTYGELARTLAARRGIPRMSAQAIGGAVGRNPIAILIPCHRVIGAHGRLVGYAGGLDRKTALLRLENNAVLCYTDCKSIKGESCGTEI